MKVMFGLLIDGKTINDAILINCIINSSKINNCKIVKCSLIETSIVSSTMIFSKAMYCCEYKTVAYCSTKHETSMMELLDPSDFNKDLGEPYLSHDSELSKLYSIDWNIEKIYENLFNIPFKKNEISGVKTGHFNIYNIGVNMTINGNKLTVKAVDDSRDIVWGQYE